MSRRHTHTIKCPHGKGRRTLVRWVLIGAVIGLFLVIFSGGSEARAAGPDLTPGFELCDPEAPVPQPPDSDLPGIFLERPETIVGTPVAQSADEVVPANVNELLRTSGMGGMRPIVYDLGCTADPTKTAERVTAWSDSTLGGWFTTWGQSFTALADTVDRRVWSPTWIATLLGNFAERTIGRLETAILLPLLGLGLMAAGVAGLNRARKGDTRGVASMVSWAALAVLIACAVLISPTALATGTQSVASTGAQALHGSTGNAGTSTTESAMRDVHYQGWLRRTFGTDESDTAKRYGPTLLAATRITWAEWDATDPSRARSDDEREEILERREKMIKAKAEVFKETAEKVEKEDPEAYEWLTGRHGSFGVAMYEWGFALVASGFRLVTDLMLVLSFLMLVLLGLIWVAASPYLVTPSGEGLGRGMLDGTASCIGFIVIGILGLWLWSIFASVVMMPGTHSAWAFILLAGGTFAFWTLLRPDRKILHLLSAGRIRSSGKLSNKIVQQIAIHVGAQYAAQAIRDRVGSADDWLRHAPGSFARGVRDEWREGMQRPIQEGQSSGYGGSAVPEHPVADPPPLPEHDTARPESQPLYDPAPEPETHPEPPPAGAVGETYYERPRAAEREDQR